MPVTHTWLATVTVRTRSRWESPVAVHVNAGALAVALARSFRAAKDRIRRGARIEECHIKLSKVVVHPVTPRDRNGNEITDGMGHDE